MFCYQRPPSPSQCCPAPENARNSLSKKFMGHCQPPGAGLGHHVPLPGITCDLPGAQACARSSWSTNMRGVPKCLCQPWQVTVGMS